MKKKKKLFFLLIISMLILNSKIIAEEQKNLVNIYFLHSNTCSHCKEENGFLNTLESKYDNVNIYKYEIHEHSNQVILKKIEEIYNQKINSVPLTIIGNKMYTGFSDKSKIKFKKTIEYFSKYGYKDNLGEYLNIELPSYNINEKDISLENYIRTYKNYNLLGLKTDDLDLNIISSLLALISSLNVISILSILLIAIVVTKIKIEKNGLIYLISYLLISNILSLKSLINNYIFSFVIYMLITLLFLFVIIKRNNKKKLKKERILSRKEYILFNLIIIMAIIVNILTNKTYNKNITIFKNVLSLHDLKGLNKIYYYSNYLIVNFIMNYIILYSIYILVNKTMKKFKIV